MGKDRLSQIQSPSGGRLSLSDLVSEPYTCCPECGADLIELPYRVYSIIECVRGCGWWDEKHPVKKWDDVAIKGDAASNEDRLGAAIKWSLESQALRCDICGELEQHKLKGGLRKALARDHCHKTNRQRGLLCSNCNTGLGFFREDPALLAKAIEYLNRHQ